MNILKTVLCWVIGLSLFLTIMIIIQKHEDKQAKVCEDKNMVIVRPRDDEAYCASGTRVGL